MSKINMNDKKLTVALLVFESPSAETIVDHIESFIDYSMHNVIKYNLKQFNIGYIQNILAADVVVIHYSVAIFNDATFPIPLRVALFKSNQFKVLFIQDEYRIVNRIHSGINLLKIDILFTCVPELDIEKVYPAEKLPLLKAKINVLTGYTPKRLLPEFARRPKYEDRNLDVVYRARKMYKWFGRLGLEKSQIADKFAADACRYNLKIDLSYKEEARIYGYSWVRFLQSSKASLGVESGSGVFDFTGELQKKAVAYEESNPNATLEDVEQKFFPGLDGKIKLNQISPRCFECAAVGTLMVLYEGEYSGVLTPWKHYVPLKKDHSNMDAVVQALRDPVVWNRITTDAYNEVACNEKYSYEAMIRSFDGAVNKFYTEVDRVNLLGKIKKSKPSLVSMILFRSFKFSYSCLRSVKSLLSKITIGRKISRLRDILHKSAKNSELLVIMFFYATGIYGTLNFLLTIPKIIYLVRHVNIEITDLFEIFYTDLSYQQFFDQSCFTLKVEGSNAKLSFSSDFDQVENRKTDIINRLYAACKKHKVTTISCDFGDTIGLPNTMASSVRQYVSV